jgi:hypothetical protein
MVGWWLASMMGRVQAIYLAKQDMIACCFIAYRYY